MFGIQRMVVSRYCFLNFRNAGFVLIGCAAVAYCLWAFYGAGVKESLWSLGMTAVAIPVYLLMRRANRSSPAAAAHRAASPESAA